MKNVLEFSESTILSLLEVSTRKPSGTINAIELVPTFRKARRTWWSPTVSPPRSEILSEGLLVGTGEMPGSVSLNTADAVRSTTPVIVGTRMLWRDIVGDSVGRRRCPVPAQCDKSARHAGW